MLPVALWAGPDFPAPTPGHLIGLAWLGLVGAAFVQRLTALIHRAGLPTRGAVIDMQDNAGRYLQLMRVDKKAEGGEIRFVVIDGPGQAAVRPAPDALVRAVIDASCAP